MVYNPDKHKVKIESWKPGEYMVVEIRGRGRSDKLISKHNDRDSALAAAVRYGQANHLPIYKKPKRKPRGRTRSTR